VIRRVPPAWSPLSLAAIARGARAALAGDEGAVAALEARVRGYLEARDVLLLDSGTSALALAIRATAGPAGAVAALPAWVCYDLATATDAAGARASLYDLDPRTLAPDPKSLAMALREASAVVIVHLFGLPVPIEGLRERAGDALIIEDAAQAAGARINGKVAGTSGDVAVLSFGRGKGLTGGGGGALAALTSRGAEVVAAARGLVGRAPAGAKPMVLLAAQWALGRPSLYALPAALPLGLGDTIYHPPHEPRAIPVACARVASENWDAALAEAAVRRSHAARLLPALGPGLMPVQAAAASEPGYLRLPVLASPSARSAAAEARRLGVMPGYPLSLADLPGFNRVVNSSSGFPGARELAQRLLTLPTHRLLSDGDLRRLADWANSQG
jgi:dTDP-4-amino-4,6-dideoxygalactose transaminase